MPYPEPAYNIATLQTSSTYKRGYNYFWHTFYLGIRLPSYWR
ncbi:hypothetical protein HMPREF0658_1836 [Hoylesella marshii DSM 16973 = JCM 13450]|uniref:Uncharacterized protein n=1 Tax=Hoylesella marshii DSM 16973 = JCM 13450 TaxID=862515 RepID=E0NUI2_9BACT|nr:hypothetical protein HMPREF0658_1836 [Hoylesella marshii DSM 16973 = JCM 13450]